MLELFANEGRWAKGDLRMQSTLIPNQYVRTFLFARLTEPMHLHTLLVSHTSKTKRG